MFPVYKHIFLMYVLVFFLVIPTAPVTTGIVIVPIYSYNLFKVIISWRFVFHSTYNLIIDSKMATTQEVLEFRKQEEIIWS